jgi:hypothetical protein
MADGNYWLSHDAQDIDDTIDEVQAARGSEASLSARLADIVSDFEADQQRQEAEIGAVAARGAKNLLKITASSQTIKGVTFTVNDDQTVTVNGLNDGTGASTFVIVSHEQSITIPDGNYILSGCPTGGGESLPFDLRWYMYSPGKSAYDSGNGASIEKSGNGTGSNIAIVVKTGQTANNIVFKPMLRRAEITDNTFVPYAPTNRELYEKIESDVVSHELVVPSGSILEYVNGLSAGFYTARQGYATGTDKPISNGGFAYLIFVLSSKTAQITAFETVVQNAASTPDIFTALKVDGTWSTWRRFAGEAVSAVQSAPASLMQTGRLDAELTGAETDEEDEER